MFIRSCIKGVTDCDHAYERVCNFMESDAVRFVIEHLNSVGDVVSVPKQHYSIQLIAVTGLRIAIVLLDLIGYPKVNY